MLGWMAALCPLLHGQSHPDIGRFEEYPMVSRVWLGSLVGEVRVNPEFSIEVVVPGKFQWMVEDGQPVAEGDVIGIAAVEKIDLLKRELELKESRFGNALIDLELANSEKRQTLVRNIDEMEEKLARMTLTETERRLLGAQFAQRLTKERATLEKELKSSRDRLDSDYFELAAAAERKALDLEIERARLDYEDLRRSSEVLAPTEGKLAIEVRDPIRKSTVVGSVIKDGLAEVRLEVADVHLRNVPGEELVIEVNGEDGRTYRGAYLRVLEETSLDRNAKIMVFDVRGADERTPVPPALDGSRMIRVFRTLAKPGRGVPKKDLVFKFPKEIDSEGWAEFFEKRWPGVRVTYVAPREIIVNPANEN
jgi:hypothetical protein